MSLELTKLDASFAAPAKPQRTRVLACVLCQQRKVKCDRKFPCLNCIKSQVQCVPATLAVRRQRHRFPERELLERIRKYEDLLHQNNISFKPLDNHLPREGDYADREGYSGSCDEQSETTRSGGNCEAKYVFSLDRTYIHTLIILGTSGSQ
jgi:hypothetical protein